MALSTSSMAHYRSSEPSGVMTSLFQAFVLLAGVLQAACYEQLPSFQALKALYPGYARFGGTYFNHRLIEDLGCDTALLLHDTSALRLSVALNRLGGVHSLGTELIRLSKYGRDSVSGRDGQQYIYHPIAYGPFLADKYGYPNVSKLHEFDPLLTKKTFWGKQGLLRVITYTKHHNLPKGHVALWDCNHFHQARDWIANHTLITVEFWESPDSDCSHMSDEAPATLPEHPDVASILENVRPGLKAAKLRHHHWEKRFLKKNYQWHKELQEEHGLPFSSREKHQRAVMPSFGSHVSYH